MTYIGKCKYCGINAYWNDNEDRIEWEINEVECLHELEDEEQAL